MEEETLLYQPDVIVCPYLTKFIPNDIWKTTKRPCLIFHPGVAGDRGPSSIDWAIRQDKGEWGGTLLQASKVMDGGDIWSTGSFPLKPDATKTGVYGGDMSDMAVDLILDGLMRHRLGIAPTPLDYTIPEVKGTLMPSMKAAYRHINWEKSADDICRIIRCSDTQPGAIARIMFEDNHAKLFQTLRVFGAHVEVCDHQTLRKLMTHRPPGSVIGRKQGALLVKSGDGQGVWITCVKDKKLKKLSLKLPATSAIPPSCATSLPDLTDVTSYREIWLKCLGPVCYVHFDFYNGAMDTRQAAELESILKRIAKISHIRVVVLMGGERFFSTGIHLCQIEASRNPSMEAWRCINKIDDVILAVSKMTDKLVVAALQGNAGAGGAMFAAAADVVLAHPGVLLSPSYHQMELYGSEYWTHFLHGRVGKENVETLMYSEQGPILAEQAHSMGLVDRVIGRNKADFYDKLPCFIDDLAHERDTFERIADKKRRRDAAWFQNLYQSRENELNIMEKCFSSQSHHRERKKFVYKLTDKELEELIGMSPSFAAQQ